VSLLVMASTRMGQLVRSFAFQSIMLAAISAVLAHYTGSEHIYIVAGLTLVVTTLGFTLFGETLRDVLDPRLSGTRRA